MADKPFKDIPRGMVGFSEGPSTPAGGALTHNHPGDDMKAQRDEARAEAERLRAEVNRLTRQCDQMQQQIIGASCPEEPDRIPKVGTPEQEADMLRRMTVRALRAEAERLTRERDEALAMVNPEFWERRKELAEEVERLRRERDKAWELAYHEQLSRAESAEADAERLRAALREIADGATGYLDNDSRLADIARAALAKGEP